MTQASSTPTLSELTGPQAPVSGLIPGIAPRLDTASYDLCLPGLPAPHPGTYENYRRMLRDPSIGLARFVAIAPILTAGWSFEADDDVPDEVVAFIQDQLEDRRAALLADAVRALDYGWAGFETVYAIEEGRLTLCKVKPLLVDITQIQILQETGEFAGYRNTGAVIAPEKCLHITHDSEAGNLYGRPLLENAREVWGWWRDANDGAARYDRKIAGVFPVVHYPPGESIDAQNKKTDNFDIGKRTLANIVAGKGILLPNEFAADTAPGAMSDKERRRWIVELLEDKGSRQPGFIDRLRYLDSLKFRSYHVPERAASEGQFGTKAEAQAHGDLVLINAELFHQQIAHEVSRQIIDTLLRYNFGGQYVGKVSITPQPIVDDVANMVRDIVKAVLTSSTDVLLSTVDFDAMLDMIGLPKIQEILDQQGLADRLHQNAMAQQQSQEASKPGEPPTKKPAFKEDGPITASLKRFYRGLRRGTRGR
jgi:hypothetical protein